MKKVQFVIIVVVVGIGAAVALGLVGSVATPGLQQARRSGNEASVVGALRAIVSAQTIYASACGAGLYAPSLTALAAPAPGSTVEILSPDLAQADTITKSGYVVTMGSTTGPVAAAPAACGLPAGKMVRGYYVTATPASAEMGTRAFAVNTDGTIWAAEQQTAIRITDTGQPAGTTAYK